MEEQGSVKSKNKLTIILGGLLALIAILVTLIIVLGLVNGRNDVGEIDDSSNISSDTNDNEALSQEEILAEAEKIYDNNPENASKTADYFVDLINNDPSNGAQVEAAAWGFWVYWQRMENPEIGLDGMMRMDVSSFNDLDKYTWYSIIRGLAYGLGDTEAVSTYDSLMVPLQYAYDAYAERTKQAVQEYEDFIKEQVEPNKEAVEAYWEYMADNFGEENKEDIE